MSAVRGPPNGVLSPGRPSTLLRLLRVRADAETVMMDTVAPAPSDPTVDPGDPTARRRGLLAWMLLRLSHQGLSAEQIAERCPLYADAALADPRSSVAEDLEALAAGDGLVVGTGEATVVWTVTPRGALAGLPAPDAEPAAPRRSFRGRGRWSGPRRRR